MIAPEVSERLTHLPAQPGVYVMRDAGGRPIYVGKAASLRSRVRSYFQDPASLAPRTRAMVGRVRNLDWIVTDTELEALILEATLIKRYHPYYNVRLRDDKKYPYIKVTVQEQWPRLVVVRDMERDGARYFGPYTDTHAMWETIRVLRQVFNLRQSLVASATRRGGCSWQPGRKVVRACLNYYIGKCLGPCIGAVSEEAYQAAVKEAIAFLEGRTEYVLRVLKQRMQAESERLNFEGAARLRDKVQAITRATEEQKMVLPGARDADVVALEMREDLGLVVLFQVRAGRLVGRERVVLAGVTGAAPEEVLGEFVKQYYGRAAFIPARILLPHPLAEQAMVQEALCERKGLPVKLIIPLRGERRHLVELAQENARIELDLELARVGEQDERAREALAELAQALGLPDPPRRIECYDISNIMGREAVGSMVVFTGGTPDKGSYRRFKIHGEEAPNDYAMMREVLARRLRAAAVSDKFAALPDLLLVDGGKGQLNLALEALADLGLSLPAAALAKEHEDIYLPDRPNPVVLPRSSKALALLQRVRDEAHRFALAYHRSLREKRVRESALDTIPGVGPVLKRRLLEHFHSLRRLREAPVEELAAVPGVGLKLAETIRETLGKVQAAQGAAEAAPGERD